MNYFIYFLLSTSIIGSSQASSFFIPDGDTGLLLSLASNTAQQLTRLEQLISETDKHTKLFRETVEMVEERYEVVDQLNSMAANYARLGESHPDSLSDINDVIENLQDQKARLKDLIQKSKLAERESELVKAENKTVERVVNSDNQTAKNQIAKSFGSGKGFSRNMERVNAQSTSLLLKETVALNGSVNTTNGLLATQNNLTKLQVDQMISENLSKENAFIPMRRKGYR
jgi:myosin heavy subunit